MKQLLVILFIGMAGMLTAQDGMVELTKNFVFRDGIYLSFESFKNNQPDLSWERMQLNGYTNPETLMTQVIEIETDTGALDLSRTWGLCIDGTPAIRVRDSMGMMTYYAALLWRGKICYYYYERDVEKKVKVSAYNPLTGKPFRTAFVSRKLPTIFEKMLDWETGEEALFTVDNFKKWIADDEDLLLKLNEMTEAQADEILLELLQNYSDRNVVFVRE
ncbi:MAG: hypothetical protein AAFO94_06440 [Bacteroidota bacterium]